MRSLVVFTSVTRRYPFYTPRYMFLNRLPEPPKGATFRIKNGLTICSGVGSQGLVSKTLWWFGDFDPWVLRCLELLAVRDGIAIDIGANIGLMSLWLAKQLGTGGVVLSYEPNPDTYSLLCQNIAANPGIARIEPVQIALSDRTGTATLNVADDPGRASLEQVLGAKPVRVEMCRLDDLLDPSVHVSVMKLDVEGHEPSVLRGARRTLERTDAVVFEVHGDAPERAEAVRLLQEAGYEVLRIYKRPLSLRLAPFGLNPPGRPTEDYVAIRPEWKMRVRECL